MITGDQHSGLFTHYRQSFIGPYREICGNESSYSDLSTHEFETFLDERFFATKDNSYHDLWAGHLTDPQRASEIFREFLNGGSRCPESSSYKQGLGYGHRTVAVSDLPTGTSDSVTRQIQATTPAPEIPDAYPTVAVSYTDVTREVPAATPATDPHMTRESMLPVEQRLSALPEPPKEGEAPPTVILPASTASRTPIARRLTPIEIQRPTSSESMSSIRRAGTQSTRAQLADNKTIPPFLRSVADETRTIAAQLPRIIRNAKKGIDVYNAWQTFMGTYVYLMKDIDAIISDSLPSGSLEPLYEYAQTEVTEQIVIVLGLANLVAKSVFEATNEVLSSPKISRSVEGSLVAAYLRIMQKINGDMIYVSRILNPTNNSNDETSFSKGINRFYEKSNPLKNAAVWTNLLLRELSSHKKTSRRLRKITSNETGTFEGVEIWQNNDLRMLIEYILFIASQRKVRLMKLNILWRAHRGQLRISSRSPRTMKQLSRDALIARLVTDLGGKWEFPRFWTRQNRRVFTQLQLFGSPVPVLIIPLNIKPSSQIDITTHNDTPSSPGSVEAQDREEEDIGRAETILAPAKSERTTGRQNRFRTALSRRRSALFSPHSSFLNGARVFVRNSAYSLFGYARFARALSK